MKRLNLSTLSMKSKTALAVSIIFLLFVSVLAVFSLSYFERQFQQTVFKQQAALVRTVAQTVDSRLLVAQDALQILAKEIPEGVLRDPDKAQSYLNQQRALLSIFDNGLLLITEEGRVLAEAPFVPGGRGRDASRVDVYKGVSETRKPYISKPFVSVRAEGRPVLSIGIPLFDLQGRMMGRLHGSLELQGKNFLADLIDMKVGDGGYLFMSTTDRILLLHPNRSRIMTPAPLPGQNVVYDRAMVEFSGSGRTVTSFGQKMLLSFQRIPSTDWVLCVNYPEAEAFAPFYAAQKVFILLVIIGTATFVLMVWLLMRYLTQPLVRMTHHVAMLADKQGEERFLRSDSSDEIGTLSMAFDQMLLQLDTERQKLRDINATLEKRISLRTVELEVANDDLMRTVEELNSARTHLVQTEKMAALGGLVAGVAHEINTPVGIGVTAASLLADEVRKLERSYTSGVLGRKEMERFVATAMESSSIVLSNLQRAAELIGSFKQVAVDQSDEQRRDFDLRHYLQDVVRSLSPQLARGSHQVSLTCPDDLLIHANPGDYSQVFTNLVMNSIVHGFEERSSGQIDIEVLRDAKEIVVRYTDDGSGIAPEHLGQIFNPFFTTRRGQGGSGLGLHVTYNIVTQGLGGSITCRSEIGKGVLFEVRVPCAAMKATPLGGRAA